ncbi:MAG: cobalt ECF transporter T component CbiQ [Bryobacteraceae bacterium]|jgi:cobalt/nickel transport system permease protein
MSGFHSHKRGGLIEHTIEGLYLAMERALHAETSAGGAGLLQRLDPRVKVAGLFALILASALATRLWVIAAVFALAILLAAFSLISFRMLAGRVWIGALTFTAAIAIPAVFLTPGVPVFHLPGLNWTITAQGLTTAGYLILRVETAATLALLLIFTTPWMHVLKALRIFRVPVVFVVILGMTCRYILLMLQTAHEMFESRKSRTVGTMTASEQRRMAVSSASVLLTKTFQLSGDVYLAMLSRGFRGEVYLLDDFQMKPLDWTAAIAFMSLTAAAVWAGR